MQQYVFYSLLSFPLSGLLSFPASHLPRNSLFLSYCLLVRPISWLFHYATTLLSSPCYHRHPFTHSLTHTPPLLPCRSACSHFFFRIGFLFPCHTCAFPWWRNDLRLLTAAVHVRVCVHVVSRGFSLLGTPAGHLDLFLCFTPCIQIYFICVLYC